MTIRLALLSLEERADWEVAEAERWSSRMRDCERWGLTPEADYARERVRECWVRSLASHGQIAAVRFMFGDLDPLTDQHAEPG